MRISYKGDYAIKTLVFLSSIYEENKNEDKHVRLGEIASRLDIPVKFLEQIMIVLKGAGYIKTIRGKNGGYAMAKKPELIKLGEIIRLIDGTTAPIACVSCSAYKFCDYENKCVLKPVWEEVRKATNEIVDNITFAGLAERETAMGREGIIYVI